jgi:predicted phage tail protein
VRLWLKDNERRPDPTPVKTDDRKAIVVGMALWLIALVVLLCFTSTLAASGHLWWLVMCGVGLVLGVVALIYSIRRHV